MKRRFRYNPDTDAVEEIGKAPSRGQLDWKPLHCEAMAFDGSIADAKRLDAEMGAPYVDYDAIGSPVFNDPSTYKRWLKAHEMVNRTSGKGNHALSPSLLKRLKERMENSDNTLD